MPIIYLNENVQLYDGPEEFDDTLISTLSNYDVVIIGERHNLTMKAVYNKLLSAIKFDYFVAEFADKDRSYTREQLKKKMDNATDGSWKYRARKPVDYQYNYWLYDLAYKHNIPLIGCNGINPDIKYHNMDEEDTFRESYMIATIREFATKGKCLVQLGDHHLRSIKITKEFLDYCGETKDDRGIYDSQDKLVVNSVSPVWKAYHNSGKAIILRLKSEYDKEVNFTKNN